MFNLDLLAQVYLISCFVGGFFIIFTIVLGQMGQMSGHHGFHLPGGHDALSGHSGAHGHIGHSGGYSADHNIAHAGTGHAVGGHDLTGHGVSGHGVSGHDLGEHGGALHGISGHHTTGVHGDMSNSSPQDWFGNFISTSILQGLRRRLLIFIQGEDIPSRIGMLLISLLSPMRIAIWLTFFGLSGFFIERLFPWLSLLSLIPAIIIAFVVSNLLNAFLSRTIDTLQSPEMPGEDELIGKVAQVYTPLTNNLIGEIVFTTISGRINCAAKAAKEGLSFKRGQRVMIIDMKDHIALVEPISDPMLLEDLRQ